MQQVRYYPRMGDIEFIAYELFRVHTDSGPASSPLIGWGWMTAGQRVRKEKSKGDPREPHPWPKDLVGCPFRPWMWAHVAFPHLVALVMGRFCSCLGCWECLARSECPSIPLADRNPPTALSHGR
jgi:hypothetical protein